MATYFHGAPEIQPDGLQTLYLMNPGYVGYSDAAAPSGMLLLNPTMGSANPTNLAQYSGQIPNLHQHFVGIPLQHPAAAATPQDSSHRPPAVHNAHDVSVSTVPGLMAPSVHYNLWPPPPSNDSSDIASSQFGPHRPSTRAPAQRSLSLSLSPRAMAGPATEIAAPASTHEVRLMAASSSLASGASNGGISGLQSLLTGSKYLKAAQELLDEVVNVDKDIKAETTKGAESKNLMKNSKDSDSARTGGAGEEEKSRKRGGGDLSTAERQELQMKKAKLVNMLDEVEHRYRQYHHQMQIVVSSFEAIAGYGSVRTYTALALQTISMQFRCLRDAIADQIRATSKSLGEEDPKSCGSRLRFVDHHLRQQRALQQLGMMQHNTWRPQRGLPERSVSILRAWLFEHFLHPYPKDSDKLMLAKQTGLTRSQVSNWFINARVRLWKPMVEEMYVEEMKDQEQNADENASKSNGSGTPTARSSNRENSPKSAEKSDSLKNDAKQTTIAIQPSSSLGNGLNQGRFYGNEAFLQQNLKKARANESLIANPVPPSILVETKHDGASNQELLLKFMDGGGHRIGDQGYPLIPGNTSHGGSYGGYTIGDLGRFDTEEFAPRFSRNSSGVSLTLGLQHPENHHLSLSGAQPSSFLSNHNMETILNTNATVAHSSNAYESLTIQDRARFSAQLLRDFVA